jgi:membrane-associated phospholipid phosphatase
MVFQTGAIINGITNLTKASVKRYRPYVYNPNVPADYKYTRNARQSFFSGHTSHSAAFTFLTAYIIDSYTNNRNIERLSYGMAFLLPAVTGYLRIASGKHFPTDVLSGFVVGVATGLLVPWIHREAEGEDPTQLQGGMNMRVPQFRLVIML